MSLTGHATIRLAEEWEERRAGDNRNLVELNGSEIKRILSYINHELYEYNNRHKNIGREKLTKLYELKEKLKVAYKERIKNVHS